jgi:hypothetical protein
VSPDARLAGRASMTDLHRYLRALAAFYIRLTFRSMEIYELLEPLMKDYRKLRIRQVGESQCAPPLPPQTAGVWSNLRRTILGGYTMTHFDEFIDQLLTEDRVCDIILPRLTQRSVLEETEGLPPRKSLLVRRGDRGLVQSRDVFHSSLLTCSGRGSGRGERARRRAIRSRLRTRHETTEDAITHTIPHAAIIPWKLTRLAETEIKVRIRVDRRWSIYVEIAVEIAQSLGLGRRRGYEKEIYQ